MEVDMIEVSKMLGFKKTTNLRIFSNFFSFWEKSSSTFSLSYPLNQFFDFHSFPQLFFKNVNGPIHPWASNPIYTQKLLPKFFLALWLGRANPPHKVCGLPPMCNAFKIMCKLFSQPTHNIKSWTMHNEN
jgi:hypothetical protein